MSTSVEVRRATPDDAAEIARVHVRAWQDGYRGQMPDDYLDDLGATLKLREDYWRDQAARSAVWVGIAGDTIVGFAAAGRTRDDESDDVGELYVINFVADAWGTGVAQRTHDEAVAHLRSSGFRSATLWVLDTNQRARRFYERNGWRVDGATKDDVVRGFPLREVRYRIEL